MVPSEQHRCQTSKSHEIQWTTCNCLTVVPRIPSHTATLRHDLIDVSSRSNVQSLPRLDRPIFLRLVRYALMIKTAY